MARVRPAAAPTASAANQEMMPDHGPKIGHTGAVCIELIPFAGSRMLSVASVSMGAWVRNL